MESLTIRTGRCLTRLSRRAAVLLTLLCCAGHASAGEEAGPEEGLALTYSAVVRTLGEPPVSTVRIERWEPKPVSPYGRANRGFFEEPILVGGEHEFSEVWLDYKPQRLLTRTQRWSRVAGAVLAAVSLLALLYTAATLAGLADFGRGNAYEGMAVATSGFYGLTGLMGGAVLLGIGKRVSSLALASGLLMHNLKMSTPRSTPGAADRRTIQLFYSPFLMVAASALFAWFAGWLVFWAYLAVFSGNVWIIFTGGVFVIFVGPLLLSLLPSVLHPWRHRGPVVIMDAEGVTDVRKKGQNRSTAWSDVGQVQLGAGDTSAFLAFEFRRPDRKRQDGAVAGGLAVLYNRAQLLSDWNISLRMLSCSVKRHPELTP
jgi:hypothetical protein